MIWGGPNPKAPKSDQAMEDQECADQLTDRVPNIHGPEIAI